MLEIDIPGRGTFGIRHVVCDYNGTIAVDGHLIEGVASRIREITEFAQVSVLTADTFGTVRTECDDLPVDVRVCLLVTMRAPVRPRLCASLAPKVACASAMASTTSLCSAKLRFRLRLWEKKAHAESF